MNADYFIPQALIILFKISHRLVFNSNKRQNGIVNICQLFCSNDNTNKKQHLMYLRCDAIKIRRCDKMSRQQAKQFMINLWTKKGIFSCV